MTPAEYDRLQPWDIWDILRAHDKPEDEHSQDLNRHFKAEDEARTEQFANQIEPVLPPGMQ